MLDKKFYRIFISGLFLLLFGIQMILWFIPVRLLVSLQKDKDLYQGDEIDKNDFILQTVSCFGITREVSLDKCEMKSDITDDGVHVTFTYRGLKQTCIINPVPIKDIKAELKNQYYEGDEVSKDDFDVNVFYSNGLVKKANITRINTVDNLVHLYTDYGEIDYTLEPVKILRLSASYDGVIKSGSLLDESLINAVVIFEDGVSRTINDFINLENISLEEGKEVVLTSKKYGDIRLDVTYSEVTDYDVHCKKIYEGDIITKDLFDIEARESDGSTSVVENFEIDEFQIFSTTSVKIHCNDDDFEVDITPISVIGVKVDCEIDKNGYMNIEQFRFVYADNTERVIPIDEVEILRDMSVPFEEGADFISFKWCDHVYYCNVNIAKKIV